MRARSRFRRRPWRSEGNENGSDGAAEAGYPKKGFMRDVEERTVRGGSAAGPGRPCTPALRGVGVVLRVVQVGVVVLDVNSSRTGSPQSCARSLDGIARDEVT